MDEEVRQLAWRFSHGRGRADTFHRTLMELLLRRGKVDGLGELLRIVGEGTTIGLSAEMTRAEVRGYLRSRSGASAHQRM